MSSNKICFWYSDKVTDPTTGKKMGSWKCRPMSGFMEMTVSSCKGDPFRLSKGKIPYVLSKSKSELARVTKTCK